MNSAIKASLLALTAAWLCSACAGFGKPAPRVEYYTLEYPPPVLADGPAPTASAVKIGRFQVSPQYNSDKIIYRDKPFSRNEYYYRKWRANPGDTIASLLRRDLQQSARLKAVFSYENQFPCEYLLEGSVDEFYELDRPDSWEAVLTVTIALIQANEPDAVNRVVFQRTYGARSTCREKSPAALAEAMSLAMAQVSAQVIHDIVQAIEPVR